VKRIGTAVLATVLLAVWAVLPVRSAPAYGPQQTIVLAIDISDAVSLDPQMAYEQSTILTDLQTYNTLVKFPIGDFRQVNPSLATSWTVSQDNKTYTFHLRHGIKFSSGNTMTAQDVVYTFQRVVNLQKDPASWLITQMGLDKKNVTSAVTAPDSYTVVISLPKPFSPGAFFSILANPVASVVDSQTVKAHVQGDDWGNAWLNDHSAGTGPFQLVAWERQVRIEMVANPNYNLGPAPSIKRIVFPNITEGTVQRQMLGRGDADIAWNLSASQLTALKQDSNFYVAQTPNLGMQYLAMDVKNVPAFSKPQVLQAVKYAIDYDGILHDLVAGNALPLQGVIPKGLFGYDPSLPFKHDVAKAKQLLSEAGFGSGFTVELLASTGGVIGGVSADDLSAKIKNDLAQIGITVNVRVVAASEMFKAYRGQQAQMVLIYWFVDYPDPDDFALPFADYTQKSLAWRLHFYNDPLSKLAEQASGLVNGPERAAAYKKLNDEMAQEGPFAILYQPMLSLGVAKRIQNLQFDPVNFIDYIHLTKQ